VKPNDLKDKELGSLRSLVVAVLVLAILYLALLLPFSDQAGAIGGAIAALTTLVGAIVGASAWRQR
jgi:hypothetical protein